MSDIKPIPVKSAYGIGGGRGGGKGGGRGGRGDRSNRSLSGQIQNQKSRPITQRLKGNSSDLEGYIFDCSDSRQADKYITAIKRIAEYVGQSSNTAAIYARLLKTPSASKSPFPLHQAIMTQLC